MVDKNKLRRTLALTASVAIIGTSVPFNVLAEGSLPKPTNVAEAGATTDQEEWQKDDFVIEDNIVKGFSDKGKEKVKTNKNLVIPDGVTKIGSSAFSYKDLISVQIPNTVITIGEGAFGRNNLKEIDLGTSVEILGKSSFWETL